MIIGVQNLSTLVSNSEAVTMTALVGAQMTQHVAPAWGMVPPSVVFASGKGATSRLDAIIGILDDADQAGDLGWHTEGPDANVYGRVFAGPVLDNGGDILHSSLSVCSVLSHEIIETAGDAACDLWAQRGDGILVARELADPCESDSYLISAPSAAGQLSGTVSDFVLPAWFDPAAAPQPTDYMSLLAAPFEVRGSGYVITMDAGNISQEFGAQYPEWRKATKQAETSRTARRQRRPVPVRVQEGRAFSPER